MSKQAKVDERPRFGFAGNLDNDPQKITEKKTSKNKQTVVVIPLPFHSPKMRKTVRDFAKTLWPKDDAKKR